MPDTKSKTPLTLAIDIGGTAIKMLIMDATGKEVPLILTNLLLVLQRLQPFVKLLLQVLWP